MTYHHISIIRPVKGKAGEVVFTVSVLAESISKAVAHVKSLVDPSYHVFQSAGYTQKDTGDNAMTAAFRKAYEGLAL